MKSLTRRTISAVLLAELLCALGFSSSALLHEGRVRLRAFDVMLQGRSDSLLGAIQDAEDPEDNVTVDPAELRVGQDDVYAVYNLGGRLLGTSKNAPAELIRRQKDGFSNRRAGGREYRVFQRGAMRVIDRAENRGVGLQRPVTILYAAPTRHLWRAILGAASFYAVVSLLLFVLTTGLMIVLLRRVLRPIEELAAQARQVSMTSLHFVAPQSALELSELRPLAVTLSETIEGLREAFEKQHRFVSDAAHELKTGVAVVRSTIQLLMMRTRSPQEYEEGLERTLADNSRVEELVSKMLLLARLEETAASHFTAIDIAPGTCSAVGNVRSFAQERGVELMAAVAADVPVRMSSDQAEILVSNLIVNAVQHSGRGSKVEVSLERKDGVAVLRVRDEGSGISAEALPHVFERFYREDKSRSRDTGGAGLGLAICKSIVESADGSIAIESSAEDGTTVTAVFSLS